MERVSNQEVTEKEPKVRWISLGDQVGSKFCLNDVREEVSDQISSKSQFIS